MPDGDAQDPGVITPQPAQQEQAPQSLEVDGELGPRTEQGQEDYGDTWAPDEILNTLGADQEQEDGADFTDQTEDFDGNEWLADDDLDWLADDDGADWLADDQAPMFNSQEELDAYIHEQAAAVLQPYAYQQEMNARRDQLDNLRRSTRTFTTTWTGSARPWSSGRRSTASTRC